MCVLAILTHSGDSCPSRFVVCFDKGLTINETVLLLLQVCELADPNNNLFVQLQDEAIVGVQMGSLERPLSDFRALNFARIIRNFKKTVGHIWVISSLCCGIVSRWVNNSWLSTQSIPEFLIMLCILLWEINFSMAMPL